jgi:hypothetical protein
MRSRLAHPTGSTTRIHCWERSVRQILAALRCCHYILMYVDKCQHINCMASGRGKASGSGDSESRIIVVLRHYHDAWGLWAAATSFSGFRLVFATSRDDLSCVSVTLGSRGEGNYTSCLTEAEERRRT